MSIDAIKHYNMLNLLGEDTLPERRQIIFHQKEIVEKHINEYQKYFELLTQKLHYYDSLDAQIREKGRP